MKMFACPCGWKVYSEIGADIVCPQCLKIITIDLDRPIAETKPASLFHELWAQLHAMPFEHWSNILEAYAAWLQRIPSTGCSCFAHWRMLTERYPLDVSSQMNCFRWTVDRHNDINIFLGKPVYSFVDALKNVYPQ